MEIRAGLRQSPARRRRMQDLREELAERRRFGPVRRE
jgi:hypothetical protein